MIFWGLGSDGTVSEICEAIKLIVENTKLYGQGYFAFSARKSGGVTESHLHFSVKLIIAPYNIQGADYFACTCISPQIRHAETTETGRHICDQHF